MHPQPKPEPKEALPCLEGAHERVVYTHHSASVIKLAAIVGCTAKRSKTNSERNRHRDIPPDLPDLNTPSDVAKTSS